MSHLLRKWVMAGLSAAVLVGAGCQDQPSQERPSRTEVASGEPV